VRYRWSLERLVHLADSLGVPVDSVGPVLLRERFNPLAAGAGTRQDFSYNTSYDVAQTQSTWRNSADYGLRRGAIFVRNSTTIGMERYQAGTSTSLRQTRASATELGWRFSPDFSLGGRVNLERFDTREPTVTGSFHETKNEYQVSMRSKQQPRSGIASTVNLFSGLLDLRNTSVEKHGVSGSLNSSVRTLVGSWLTQEMNGTVDGNLSRTRVPTVTTTNNTRDFSENVRGSVSLFQSSAVGFRGNFSFRHIQVETPSDSGPTRRALTDNSSGDATVRLRLDNDRYLDFTQRTGTNKQATVVGAVTRTTRRDDAFSANARYLLWGWAIEGRFQNSFANSAFPTRSDSGGYGEFVHLRNLDGSVIKQISNRLNGKISAGIALTSYRYFVIGKYPTPPVSRDQLRQSWRATGIFTGSAKFSTTLSLEVTKSRFINIPSASTGSNNSTRSYRSEWSWTYRLLPDLTATQRNTLSADYLEYTFLPENNRLTLDYGAVTTLNAVVTPRLSITLTHNVRQTPGGNYTLYPDGLSYFERADETKLYNLTARLTYAPSNVVAFTFEPKYYANDRSGTVNGLQVPQRSSRSLDFSSGANLNWPVGAKGLLRGDIHRTYRADRSATYSSGLAQFSPRSELDYWNGSLQLSWQL
jgi:hypothetical protein